MQEFKPPAAGPGAAAVAPAATAEAAKAALAEPQAPPSDANGPPPHTNVSSAAWQRYQAHQKGAPELESAGASTSRLSAQKLALPT